MSELPAPAATLISLASRQAWPQLLVWRMLKPARIFLLHSADRNESEQPAARLSAFLEKAGCEAFCEEIPHDDYEGILGSLDKIAARHHLAEAGFTLNFTGGNKLMATAAYQWACGRRMPSCYLERGNQLFRFHVDHAGAVHSARESLDPRSCDDLDALDIVRCQLDSSEIERPGELLTLNQAGQELSENLFKSILSSQPHTIGEYLHVQNGLGQTGARGDHLELLAAATLLKLGVGSVRRSLRIRPPRVLTLPGDPPLENEFDLVFNHAGRLWVVDCKDRKPPENLAGGVEKMLRKLRMNPFGDPSFRGEWSKVKSAVTSSPMKVMKEDLLAAQSLGGLLGQVICVRKSEPSDEIVNFARSKGIHLVTKSLLLDGFKGIRGLFS